MYNIKWESWAPYLEKPSVLMAFVVLLVTIITRLVLTKNRHSVSLTHKVTLAFLAIAIFVVLVAAYKLLQDPPNSPHKSSPSSEKTEPTTRRNMDLDKGTTQSTNVQIINGSHNSITNQVGKIK